MKKETENLVKSVAEMQPAMSAMTMDKVSEVAPKATELKPVELTLKERAREQGIPYVEPKRKLQAFGVLPSKWKKKHAEDWEYVKGVFNPEVMGGRVMMEPIEFWHCKWPGDPDCWWSVPVNRPVYLPRMIALHLAGERDCTGSEAMKYHTFDYVERPTAYWRPDEYTHQFTPVSTQYRGQFVAIGAFS